jgi:manganese/iron transport system permease protein
VSVLWDSLQTTTFRWAVVEVVLVGAIGGVVGVHVLLRRLPFFVVAMSHAMFPGVVLASVLGVSLFVGGTAFGLVVVAAVTAIGASRVIDQSSAIGVVLAGAFAVGVLVLSAQPGSSRDLSAFLVGSILTVTPGDVAATVIGGGLVLVVLAATHKELVASAFDPAGSAALGYPVRRLDTMVLAAVTVTMATTIPATGTLLSVALLTVPALTARLWTERVGSMMAVAAAVGAASGLLGLAASTLWRIAAGGAIGLAAAALFGASLAVTAWHSPAATTSGVAARLRVRRAA